MRVFIIGGTAFTGPALVAKLLAVDYEVAVFHRGQTHDSRTAGAREIIGDRRDRSRLKAAVSSFGPEVIVDMIPFTAADAEGTMEASSGLGRQPRLVGLSSIDVYLAYGRIHRTETGPLQPIPLTEGAALRETDQPEGPARDKIAVERAYLGAKDSGATILRLPAIYGERDKLRRFRSYLKRMDDGRPVILLGSSVARWRFSRGYVENVADAIVLAIGDDDLAGEVFNVAEPSAMREREFVSAIGEAAGWKGEIMVVPDGQLPEHLQTPVDFSQDWVVDTSKIRSRLGYSEAVGMREAFGRTVAWERKNPPQEEPYPLNYEAEDKVLQQLAE